MIEITDKKNCCGCTACYNICTHHAIEMKQDSEGFLYPVVNKEKCVNCGLCEKICPITNPVTVFSNNSAYVYQSKDENILSSSTSGGFVDLVFRRIISGGGYVVGVIYDENNMPTHTITNKPEVLPKLRGSKYAQSTLDGIFSTIRSLLLQGNLIAFCGTPCQVAGLKSYLQKDYVNLYTIDLVCRSIPSPLFWGKYLEWQENRINSKICNINCRNKTYGYHNGTLTIEFEDGRIYSGSNRVDPYMKCFHSDVCSRPSCYECKFKTKLRCSDFTVFDSWYPENVTSEALLDNNKGYSNIIVHTKKGEDFINSFDKNIFIKAYSEKMFLYTGSMESESIRWSSKRANFYNMLNAQGFMYAVRHSVKIKISDYIVEKLKPIYFIFQKSK